MSSRDEERLRAAGWIFSAAVAVPLLACASRGPAGDGVVDTRTEARPAGEDGRPTEDGRPATEPRSADVRTSPISSSFHLGTAAVPKIDATCEGAPPATCGSAQRIAIERNQVAGFGTQREPAPPPCTPRRLAQTRDMNLRSYCLDGAYLYAREDCGPCRVPSYREVVAKLDELTAEQRQEVGKLLGVEGQAPVDAAGWQDVLDRRTDD